MRVLRIAQVPAPTALVHSTVLEAIRTMQNARCGAVVVLEAEHLVGIFTERDVMLRVVAAQRDAETTRVQQVMSSPVKTVTEEHDIGDALEVMISNHIRHLPIVDREGILSGFLSIRHLLRNHVVELAEQLNSLEAYFSDDGPGV